MNREVGLDSHSLSYSSLSLISHMVYVDVKHREGKVAPDFILINLLLSCVAVTIEHVCGFMPLAVGPYSSYCRKGGVDNARRIDPVIA